MKDNIIVISCQIFDMTLEKYNELSSEMIQKIKERKSIKEEYDYNKIILVPTVNSFIFGQQADCEKIKDYIEDFIEKNGGFEKVIDTNVICSYKKDTENIFASWR